MQPVTIKSAISKEVVDWPRREVPRLLRDNAFAFGFGCGSRGGRQKRTLGKKAEKITGREGGGR